MPEDKSMTVTVRELMPSIEAMLDNGETVALTVRGVSMQPFLMDGRDTVLMVSARGRVPRVGDLYMFRRDDGSYAMHRIFAVADDGSLGFVGDGQLYVERGIPAGSLVACVPAVIRNGKTINCEKGLAHRLMTARMKLRINHPRFRRGVSGLKRFARRLFSSLFPRGSGK